MSAQQLSTPHHAVFESTALVTRLFPFTPSPTRRPSEAEARHLADAFIEGWMLSLQRFATQLFPDDAEGWLRYTDKNRPGYADVRNHLTGDWDCDERIAAKVAMNARVKR